MKTVVGFCVMVEVVLLALAMATAAPQEQKQAPGPSPAVQAQDDKPKAAAPAKPVPEAPMFTEDEKKDLTILNQGMVIQQQRFQLLQAQMAAVQQEYSRLAGERNQRLAKAKAEHKWGEDVTCNPDELACAKVAPQPKGKK